MEKKNLYTEHKCVNDNIPPLPKQALKITSSKMVKEKLILIKVGGKIVEEPDSLKQLLLDFSKIEGHKVLVHGGGRSATALASKLGVESKMVNGRRITDEETLKVVTMVYGGLVNKQIVAGLQLLGINALGLTGADMNYMISDKRPVKEVDYGFVGDVKKVNAEILADLIAKDIVPVLAPLTHDGKGNMLNTNADTIAGEAAKALVKYFDVTLMYCFEKKGVLSDENNDESVIPIITGDIYKKLIEENVVQGGMIPKIDNAFDALKAGVKEVIITRADLFHTNGGTKMQL
ncbi:Acetylglutamate kinase [uncultured Paludibacter sp.]|nr:Acetylglutamate kinase [uncultured Paludibacter sp.]